MRKTALCYIAVKGKYQDMNQIFLTQFFSSLLWDVRVMMVLDMQEVYWGKYLWRIGEQGATLGGKITVLMCKWGEGTKKGCGRNSLQVRGRPLGSPQDKVSSYRNLSLDGTVQIDTIVNPVLLHVINKIMHIIGEKFNFLDPITATSTHPSSLDNWSWVYLLYIRCGKSELDIFSRGWAKYLKWEILLNIMHLLLHIDYMSKSATE